MKYITAKPVVQVAFCDFTLFKDAPEFCSTYKLPNVKKPEVVYSDKLVITNINLTRTDLATEDDKEHGIDVWAEMFKAGTWEEMKMLAEKDEMVDRAVSGVWQLTEEEKIRERCRAREEWIALDNYKNERMEQQERILKEQNRIIREYEVTDKHKSELLEQQKEEIEKLREELLALKEGKHILRSALSLFQALAGNLQEPIKMQRSQKIGDYLFQYMSALNNDITMPKQDDDYSGKFLLRLPKALHRRLDW